MSILVFNCGSSSLKLALIDVARVDGSPAERVLWSVAAERIGGLAIVRVSRADGTSESDEVPIEDHVEAVQATLDALSARVPSWRDDLAAVGHRLVHGGRRFREPVLLDDEVTAYLHSLAEVAPLHNAPALAAAAHSQTVLGASMPMVAVFDTAFHRTMPDYAAQYAIPHELTTKHEIYRYGFHGLAHRDMAEQYAHARGAGGSTVQSDQKVITLQLGNGCSLAAVKNGMSIDTSMGFTPLEGLVMGTRSGDIDPAAVSFLARREGVSTDDVVRWLNTRSGMLGVSGRSGDVRDLLQAEADGDPRAALALEMFCYRARQYVGAYMAALGGVDGIVFGGGIGEHAPAIRSRICEGMEWAGLKIDRARNGALVGTSGLITTDDSPIDGYVFTVDEERLIARETAAYLELRSPG